MKKSSEKIKETIKSTYSNIVKRNKVNTGCGCAPDCCQPSSSENMSNSKLSINMGYTREELQKVPDGANLGLGCGNPQAIASIKSGETVLDLGSGAGFDVFLAANQTGPAGMVIGIDMTDEMISKARENADKGNYKNVEFRQGEIENLPVDNNSVDVIISNCVINLSPEKQRVFNESFRVLKSGGRLAVSDIVAIAKMPGSFQNNMEMYAGCISGASSIEKITEMLQKAGFTNINISPKNESKDFIKDFGFGNEISKYIISATIEAIKP